jgi:hypothetical protein
MTAGDLQATCNDSLRRRVERIVTTRPGAGGKTTSDGSFSAGPEEARDREGLGGACEVPRARLSSP